MIHYVKGDILQAHEHQVDAVVNPANTVGAMGKGLALSLKTRFPWCYEKYRQFCLSGALKPGYVLPVENPTQAWPRFVLHLPTKRHFRSPSNIEDVTEGLVALKNVAECLGLNRVALPRVGCGLGGLDWKRVKPIVEATLVGSRVEFLLFEGEGSC